MMKPEDSISHKAITGSFWTSTSNWLLKFTTAFSLILTLKALSVYQYGLVQLVLSFFSVGVLFNLSAFHDVIVTEIAIAKGEGRERQKGLYLTFLKAQSILSFILFLVFFLGAPLINRFAHGADAALYIRLVSLFFLLSPLREAYMLLLSVELKFYELAIFSVVEQVSRLLILVLTLYVFKLKIAGVLLASILSQVVTMLVCLPMFRRSYSPLKVVEGVRVRLSEIFLRHGKWAVAVSYISNFNSNMRIWLTQYLLGTEAVGLFELAANLFSHTRSLLPISEVVTPIIPQYVHVRERFVLIINKALKYSMLAYIAVGIAAFLVFPPIIIYLFPKYIGSMGLYRIMLIALIPHSMTVVLVPLYYSLREQRSLFFAYVRRIVATAVVLPIMAHYFGIVGLAIEFVVTAIFLMVDRLYMAKKLVPEIHLDKRVLTFDEYDRTILMRLREKVSGFF